MKWIQRLTTTAGMMGMLYWGVQYQQVWMIAVALTVPYLFSILLFERFEKARDGLIYTAMSLNNRIGLKPVIPHTTAEGVHFFQQNGEVEAYELRGYHFSVSELESNLVTDKSIKGYHLEKTFARFVRDTRYYLVLTQLLGVVLAGYMVYTESAYLYLVIPFVMGVYHYFFYAHVFQSASALKWARRMNEDREFLTALMQIYVKSVLQIQEATNMTVGVFPMGDIVVRFTHDEKERFYYVPYEDRMAMEEIVDLVVSEIESNESQPVNK